MNPIAEYVEKFEEGELPPGLPVEVIAGILAFKAKEQRSRDKDIEIARRSTFDFAVAFIETKNEDTAHIEPFPAFPYFKEVVFPGFHAPGNCLWEKSRRVLMSIAACVYVFHHWLVDDLFMVGMTSRSQNKVDDGGGHSTWDSLFGKMRFFYDRMIETCPHVLEHYLGRVYDSGHLFKKLSLQHPKTSSTVIGEAPTPNCLTGGGFMKCFVDETARVPNMHSIHGNLILAGKDLHYISYPNGPNGTFYRIRSAKDHFGFRVVRVHWSMRPDRNDEWYREQCKKMSATEVGMLLDISYSMSAEAKCFPNFTSEGERSNVRNALGIQINEIQLWWDFGHVDATVIILVQFTKEEREGKLVDVLRIKGCVTLSNTNYQEVATAVKLKLKQLGFSGDTKKIQCFGDPQVKQAMIDTGLTLQKRYLSVGFNIHPAPVHETRSVLDEINLMFARREIFVDANAVEIIDAFNGWEWPKNRDSTIKQGVLQPEHSEHSHIGKAFEYGMAVYFQHRKKAGGKLSAPKKKQDMAMTRAKSKNIRRGLLHQH